MLFGLDVLHGFRTQLPVPLGEAATFNPRLARLAAERSAREASYIGVQWTYAPMADMSRDTAGAASSRASARILISGRCCGGAGQGFSGRRPRHRAEALRRLRRSQGGRDYDLTNIPPAELRDIYLPPFRAALQAGSVSLMAAFNALNGMPATANRWLLTEVLRNEWGFDGFVTSDWARHR